MEIPFPLKVHSITGYPTLGVLNPCPTESCHPACRGIPRSENLARELLHQLFVNVVEGCIWAHRLAGGAMGPDPALQGLAEAARGSGR